MQKNFSFSKVYLQNRNLKQKQTHSPDSDF